MGNTPYIIESNILSQQGQEQAWNQGLYQVSTDLWAFIAVVDLGTSDIKLGAYKSSDGLAGQAFTQQALSAAISALGGSAGVSYFGPVGGKMYAAFPHVTSNELNLTDFTFAGTTWSAPITGGPVIASPHLPNPLLFRKTGGDRVVIYYDGANTQVLDYSGGWGAPTAIGAGAELKSAVIDTNDVVHIIFFDGTDFLYFTWAAGVLSAGVAVYTPSGPNSMGPGTYDAGADELIFPIIDVSGHVQNLSLLRGTPSSAPVWTSEVAGDSGRFDAFLFPNYFKILGEDYAFVEVDRGTGTPHIAIVYYKKTAGAWGTQQVFWDELANPGVPPQTIIDDKTLWSARLFDDGTTLGCTVGLLPLGSAVLCAEQYALIGAFSAPPPPPNPTLACPIASLAIVGTPYTATLIASSGTPPYTYSIIGGALPPSLTLDPTTGVISGIPLVLGTFNYTAQVTDANGLTAQVTGPCTLPVGGGGRGPCDNVMADAGNDSYVELRKVLVAIAPVKHMPVRGRS